MKAAADIAGLHSPATGLANERLLTEVVRSLPVAMAVADYNDRAIFINEKFTSLMGFTIEDLPTVSDAWPKVYPDEQYRAQVMKSWQAAVGKVRAEGGEFTPQQYRITRKDGVTREVEFRYKPLDGYYVVMAEDVTERQQVEAALQESERKFRTLAESSQAAILLYQKDQFIYGNPAAESITGYGVEEIIGISLWDVVHPESQAGVKERMRARLRGEMVPSRHEIRIITKQGEDRWVDYSIGIAELYGRQTAILTVFDITERKQAETALSLSEERSSLAFHESGTAMAIASLRDRRTIEANPAWLAMIGLERESVIGHPPEEYGIRFSGIQPGALFSKLAQGQAVRNVELGIHIGHGSQIGATRELVTLASGVPININGEPCILWGVQDITALKHTEAELRGSREQLRNLAARLQTIREENLASVAREIHDELGQALTSLKLELRWLDGLLGGAPRTVHDKIASMLDLVGATIDNMRRMATALRPGILDDFGLVAALEWQAQDFASRTGVPCLLVNKTGNEDDLPLDRDRATAVFRIFQESLTNVARHASATKVVASLTQTDEMLILKVRDNGRGITPAELTNASSLGLIGMRERAQMFGGAFDMRGKPGKGTTLRVSMPLNSTHAG
ncbi:MAG: PAS domain S-box protein, partial [Gammaproteobacteria bacterium]